MVNSSGLTHCPTIGTPYLYTDSQVTQVRRIIKTRCKLWTCPYCSEINAIGHYIRVLNGCNELQKTGKSINFITLTSHEKVRTFERGYFVWQSAWRRLQERVRRKLNADSLELEYIYLFEPQKSGALHVHGLFTGELKSRWWKDNARQVGLGYQAKSESVDNGGLAASYLVKYISKNMGLSVPIKRMRRINYSRGFPPAPSYETGDSWTIVAKKQSIESVIEDGWSQGLDVDLLGKRILELE